MGHYTYKTLVRDALVDDATIKTLFSAAATGSTRVNMEHLEVSAIFPQILIGWGGGETTPNMDADKGRVYLTIECKGTGTTHAFKEMGKFRAAIINAIDDTNLSGTAVCYHLRKFSEIEGFDGERGVNWLRLSFDGEWRQNTSLP